MENSVEKLLKSLLFIDYMVRVWGVCGDGKLRFVIEN